MSVSADMPPGLGEALESDADRIRPFGSRVVHLRGRSGPPTTWRPCSRATARRRAPLVIADAQTAGRGRMGHTWYSPPGAGLYVSVVLRPPRAWLTAAPGLVNLVTLDGRRGGRRGAAGRQRHRRRDQVAKRHRRGPQRPVIGCAADGGRSPGSSRRVPTTAASCSTSCSGTASTCCALNTRPRSRNARRRSNRRSGGRIERTTVLVETLAALSQGYAALAEGRRG